MKRLFLLFLLTISVDVFNKNFYLAFSDRDTVEKVYWTGQSVSFLAYCILAYALARKLNQLTRSGYAFALMVASMNWIAFAVGDLVDELTQTYAKSSLWEYLVFLFTIPYTVYLWKRRKLRLS